MKRGCVTCGRHGAQEAHHVAGRANNAVTVAVCVHCHRRYLTPWQRASGIPLGGAASELQGQWALGVGVLHVLRLAAQRYGLPDAVRATAVVEALAVVAMGDDVPPPTVTRTAVASANGCDVETTAAELATLLPLFTNDPHTLTYFAAIASGDQS